MPIRLAPPTVSTLRLAKSDIKYEATDPTMVDIRLATQHDVEARNELFAEYKREYEGSKVTVSQRLSYDDVRRKEVFLVLAACNIETLEGKPLFQFENGRLQDEKTFKKAWDLLPPSIVEELYELVLQINPVWDMRGEQS
jgi:hypothetical protein